MPNHEFPTDPDLMVPGLKPVLELIEQTPQRVSRVFIQQPGRNYERLILMCRKAGIPVEQSNRKTLDALSQGATNQGVIAIINRGNWISFSQLLEATHKAPLPLLIALDQVQDPRNLGAVARTAWALGCAGLLLPQHNSASLGPAAYKASAGALRLLSVCSVTNLAKALDKADEAGLHIFGTTCDSMDAINAYTAEWALPAVLVLGNEEKGVRPGVLKRCHSLLTIPFARPFDSLNIAQTGAILMALCAIHAQAYPAGQ